jgi:ribosome-associated protein
MATTKKSSTAKKSAPAKKAAPKKSAPAAKKAAAPKRAPAAKKAAPKKVAAKKVAPKGSPAALAKKAVKKAPAPPPPPRSADEVRRDEAQALALALAAAALDKKAERIEIIDVYGKADYADFLVLMSGRVDRQVQAIAQAVEARAEERGQRARSVEGARQGQWVVVDFGDVVAHVFIEEERRNRDLESLWIDARRVPFIDAAAPASAAT